MTLDEAARILREMYDNAPPKEGGAMVVLFGIRYAKDIQDSGLTATAIQRKAGFGGWSEVGKGITLAKYVIEKDV